MPMQNRVDPEGQLHATSARGLFMGNRGCLHDAQRRLTCRKPPTRRWIICLTEFRGRKREVMAPGRYAELFFLDEATALSAGHRPCYECRRADALAFASAAARSLGCSHLNADALDAQLATQRARPSQDPARRIDADTCAALPVGSCIRAGHSLLMRAASGWLPWSFEGYGPPINPAALASGTVWRVTPPLAVAALAFGYPPLLHPTAVAARA